VAWYESPLEKDFMYLLDYNHDVSYWHEQPLRIRFTHGARSIVIRLTWRFMERQETINRGQTQSPGRQGKWEVLFRAASSICEEEGYQFLVVTDEIIRVQPRLENVKLLWKYARTPVFPQHQVICSQFFQSRKDDWSHSVISFSSSRGNSCPRKRSTRFFLGSS